MRKFLNRVRPLAVLAAANIVATTIASGEVVSMPPSETVSTMDGMAKLPDGVFKPLFAPTAAGREKKVKGFYLDVLPVTTADYLDFVKSNPQWQRSRVKAIYADESYLKTWESDLVPGASNALQSPVTHVSWFAANAYAKSKGKRLPTVAEWEYAAAAGEHSANGTNEPEHLRKILAWYNSPSRGTKGTVGQNPKNFWGVQDLHGLVWEWVSDFNSSLVSGDARNDGGPDSGLFCGAGAQGAKDVANFPAFMRYGFRSSLKADYCVHNLGFRCAKDIPAEPMVVHACCAKAVAPATDSQPSCCSRELAAAPYSTRSLFNLDAQWQSESDKTMRLGDRIGKPEVLVMFFASCQSACPILVNDVMRIESALPPELKSKINFTLVSFDSVRDTPIALKTYKEVRQLGSNWKLLHGQPNDIQQLAALLGVRYQKTPAGGFNHSNLITVLNSKGEVVYQLSGLNQDIAPAVTALTKEANRADVAVQ